MKLFSKSLLVSAAALALAPTSALALFPDCDMVCFVPAPCNAQCTNPWSTTRLTCGSWIAAWGNLYPENTCVQSASAAPESACDAEQMDSAEDSDSVCLEPTQAEER